MCVEVVSMYPLVQYIGTYVPGKDEAYWGMLFTFCAILIAILSLWAQLTVRISQNQDITKQKLSTLSLFWIYMAILCSLVALGFLFYARVGQLLDFLPKFILYRIGLGLMLASFLMGSIHVFESVVTLAIKIKRNLNLYNSLVNDINHQIYKCSLYCFVASAAIICLFSILGTLFGAYEPLFYWFWAGNIIALLILVWRYQMLMKTRRARINALLSHSSVLNNWKKVYDRLPTSVQRELADFVKLVRDTDNYPNKRYVYGCYSDGDHSISLYYNDIQSLSDMALKGVIAHELGHAYCHMICGTPSPFEADIDKGANCIASAWGFSSELRDFSTERKPEENTKSQN